MPSLSNIGHFDDISLVEEPAQTYTYDSEGNLRASTSTGNSDETFQYDGADLTKQIAGGYGTYEYEYHNHNMTKATNDNVSVTASYDESGNSTGTKLQKKDGTGVYLQTSATYTPNRAFLTFYIKGTLAEDEHGLRVSYTIRPTYLAVLFSAALFATLLEGLLKLCVGTGNMPYVLIGLTLNLILQGSIAWQEHVCLQRLNRWLTS